MRITILPSAQEDLNTIFEYIARDSIFYAEQVNTKITTTIGYFYASPRMGKQIKENPETREYVGPYKYIIRYKIIEDRLYVSMVYKYQNRPF